VQVPTYKLITPAVVSERLKIGGSLARAALRDMCEKGQIRAVVLHHGQRMSLSTRCARVAFGNGAWLRLGFGLWRCLASAQCAGLLHGIGVAFGIVFAEVCW
jgi:hypothetical protein